MLIGIDPLLRGDMLNVLDRMGHGDVLVVADANFPAARVASHVIDLAGVSAATAMSAVATVFPLDGEEPITIMRAPGGRTAVQTELIESCGLADARVDEIDRFNFYEAARAASLVLVSGETRPYGNVLVRKGVVG